MTDRRPEYQADSYDCPHCGVLAKQRWAQVSVAGTSRYHSDLLYVTCDHCQDYQLWVEERLIYPDTLPVPLPNQDLDPDIQADYREAASVVRRSPRGASALLRLALQKLCKQLGQTGDNINADIAALVKQGLPTTIQQALDAVRVIGNEAVHPGELDLHDDLETALALFDLLNLIADNRISEPKRVQAIYDRIPQSKKDGIVDRDTPKT